MIPGIENTPPEVALMLGFFIALSLKRGRVELIIDRWLPTSSDK